MSVQFASAFIFVIALLGCGERQACSDSPLGGSCTPIEGTWLLQTAEPLRCAHEVFDDSHPIRMQHPGNGNLNGSVGREMFIGLLFPEGAFQLFSVGSERHFTVHGQHLQRRGKPDELSADVSYGARDECEGGWHFIALRE